MRTLVFDVSEQKIEKNPKCNFSNIVSGSENFLIAKFNFDKTWNGYGRVAVFKKLFDEYPVIINKNGECLIPSEVLRMGSFQVSVVGKTIDGKRLTTNYVKIDQII